MLKKFILGHDNIPSTAERIEGHIERTGPIDMDEPAIQAVKDLNASDDFIFLWDQVRPRIIHPLTEIIENDPEERSGNSGGKGRYYCEIL